MGLRRIITSRWKMGRWLTGERISWSALVALAVLATPSIVKACSVCTAGRDEENQAAFLLSTLFMSLLPLVVIGTIVYFLWRRIQKFEIEEEAKQALRRSHATAQSTHSVL